MQAIWVYANVCLWPKADIETESKSLVLNVRFREKSRRLWKNEQLLGQIATITD